MVQCTRYGYMGCPALPSASTIFWWGEGERSQWVESREVSWLVDFARNVFYWAVSVMAWPIPPLHPHHTSWPQCWQRAAHWVSQSKDCWPRGSQAVWPRKSNDTYENIVSWSAGLHAPECLDESPKYNTQLDIFSFGHLTIYLANQKAPVLVDRNVTPAVDVTPIKKTPRWLSTMA